MTKMVWDNDRIAALALPAINTLRANALRIGEKAVVELCDAELARRVPKKTPTSMAKKPAASKKKGRYVVGFHFVCDNDKGVSENSDGTFWSGTWVVDKQHADRGMSIGAYVALHKTKSEPSYRQGTIKAWREVERERQYGEQPVKIEVGIDFLLQPTHEPYAWIGSGTGEKGYAWDGD